MSQHTQRARESERERASESEVERGRVQMKCILKVTQGLQNMQHNKLRERKKREYIENANERTHTVHRESRDSGSEHMHLVPPYPQSNSQRQKTHPSILNPGLKHPRLK